MWHLFQLKNIARYCFSLSFSSFSRNNVNFANNNNNNSKQGMQVAFRSLFVEQETGRLLIVYEVKIKSYSI